MKVALVVDDSQYFRQIIKNILEEYNFKVIEEWCKGMPM